jgi:hypothetical protein
MQCRLYSPEGRLIHEGPCGLRQDGAIELPTGGEAPLQPGDALFTLEEGPRRYPVRITKAHPPRNPALGDLVIYHLLPVVPGA